MRAAASVGSGPPTVVKNTPFQITYRYYSQALFHSN